MKNRKGIVRINKKFITGEWGCDLGMIFKEIIPLAITETHNDIFEYKSLSKHFDELSEGEKIPFYDAIICHETNKRPFVRFDRIK